MIHPDGNTDLRETLKAKRRLVGRHISTLLATNDGPRPITD